MVILDRYRPQPKEVEVEDINRWLIPLFGSEDGDGDGSGGETPPEGETPPDDDQGEEGEFEDLPDDHPVLRALREVREERKAKEKEARSLRSKLWQTEKELSERKKAEMDDLERTQTELAEERETRETLEETLRAERLEHAVTMEAVSMNFHDPADAIHAIDLSDLSFDEENGRPTTDSIKKALSSLAEDKPYLIKTDFGDGDGGPRGPGGQPTREERVRQYEEEYQEQGMIPIQ